MTLPSTLASDIIDLEDQVSNDLDENLLRKLLGLYSQAIEYYESINDKKYLNYLARMRSFISRREVKALLKLPCKNCSTSLLAERSATKTIELNTQESHLMFKQAQENIKSQCVSLPKRIQERKISKSSEYLPFSALNNKLIETFDLYETNIQEVMEAFILEKQEVVGEIEKRYEEALEEYAEIEEYSSMDQFISNHKQRMNAEILQAVKRLEKKKNDKIRELRLMFLQP